MPNGFKINIDKATVANAMYREVLFTTAESQLVLMNIPTGESIGREKHVHTTQFIRVESGRGVAVVNQQSFRLKEGDAIMIPANTWHDVKSTHNLKIYTLYSPPEHPKNLVQRFKEEEGEEDKNNF